MRVGTLGGRRCEGEPVELTVRTTVKGSKASRWLWVTPIKQRLAEDKINFTLANQANLWPKSQQQAPGLPKSEVVHLAGIEPMDAASDSMSFSAAGGALASPP